MADAARVAAQAIMQERYALDATSAVADDNAGKDYRWDDPGTDRSTETDKEWGLKILELMGRGRGDAGNEPYLFVFGVGNPTSSSMSFAQQHTVYYVAYVEDRNSPGIFYVNGTWMYTYPRDDSSVMREVGGIRNTIVLDGVQIPLQLIVVSNRTGQSANFWTGENLNTLQGHAEGHNGF